MNTTTEQPNPDAKPMTALKFSASLLAKNRKQLLEIASGLSLTIDPKSKNHEIIAEIMEAKTEVGEFATVPEPAPQLAPRLDAALDEIIFQNPGPSPHPDSADLIRNLEAHYATGDLFAPIKNLPACLGVNFAKASDLTKPTTKAALLAEVELLAPEKLARLKELAAEHDAAIAEQIKYSPTSALLDYDAQRIDIHEAATSDRNADIAGNKFRQRDDIQREYREKVGAIAERMKLISKDAFPLVRETIVAIENHLKDFIRAREDAERAEAEVYDLEWKPSLIWKAAAMNLITARNQIKSYTGRPDQGPRQMLGDWIGIINLK